MGLSERSAPWVDGETSKAAAIKQAKNARNAARWREPSRGLARKDEGDGRTSFAMSAGAYSYGGKKEEGRVPPSLFAIRKRSPSVSMLIGMHAP